MTVSIPLNMGGGRAGLETIPAAASALRACAPLALYLGGQILFREAALRVASDTPYLRLVAAIFGGGLALLFLVLAERRAGRDALATVGLRGRFGGALGRGLLLYAAASPLLFLASSLGARWFPNPEETDWLASPVGGSLLLARIAPLLGFLLAVPLLEEILFRGWTQGAAAARVGPWLAIPAVAGVWTLGHPAADRPAILLLGLLLGFLYRRTGRLAACVGVHALHNALALFFVPSPGWFEWTGA